MEDAWKGDLQGNDWGTHAGFSEGTPLDPSSTPWGSGEGGEKEGKQTPNKQSPLSVAGEAPAACHGHSAVDLDS